MNVIIILFVIIVFIGNLNIISSIGIIINVLLVFIILDIKLMILFIVIKSRWLNLIWLVDGVILINIKIRVNNVIII